MTPPRDVQVIILIGTELSGLDTLTWVHADDANAITNLWNRAHEYVALGMTVTISPVLIPDEIWGDTEIDAHLTAALHTTRTT